MTPKFANKRAAGITLLREWAREEANFGDIRGAHRGLFTSLQALMGEFRVEFDVPGTRYWYHPESESYFSTMAGESPGDSADGQMCIELNRAEFLGRQGLHFGYDDRL